MRRLQTAARALTPVRLSPAPRTIQVPARQTRQTPVFIRATAGLRLVSQSAAAAILESCRAAVRNSPFLSADSWTSILHGSDEGVLGWIAGNYLWGGFEDGSGDDRANGAALAAHPTIGIVELGGASLQMTFAVEEGSDGFDDAELSGHVVDVHIAGKLHTVYTHSYLGYGQEAAARAAIDAESARADGDPCYPVGYSAKDAKSGLMMHGGGSYELCLDHIETKLLTDVPGRLPSCYDASFPQRLCTFEGVYQPTLRGPFLAIENFVCVHTIVCSSKFAVPRRSRPQGCSVHAPNARTASTDSSPPRALCLAPSLFPLLPIARACRYTSQFFGLAGAGAGNKSYTLAELERKGAQFCRTPWAVLASRHAGEFGLQDYCFSAAFISALLRRGLSFPTSSVTIGPVEPHRVAIQRRQRNTTASGVAAFVSNSIDGAKIDWAIGAFIKYHAEAAGDWGAYGRADARSVVVTPVPRKALRGAAGALDAARMEAAMVEAAIAARTPRRAIFVLVVLGAIVVSALGYSRRAQLSSLAKSACYSLRRGRYARRKRGASR